MRLMRLLLLLWSVSFATLTEKRFSVFSILIINVSFLARALFNALPQYYFLDPEGSLSATTVVLVVLVVVTRFRKMPTALLIRNGKLRNFANTFVTLFPTDLYRLRFFN